MPARQYAVRSETIEWWSKPPGVHTFNPALAAERYTPDEKKVALAKGVGRVSEASLDNVREWEITSQGDLAP